MLCPYLGRGHISSGDSWRVGFFLSQDTVIIVSGGLWWPGCCPFQGTHCKSSGGDLVMVTSVLSLPRHSPKANAVLTAQVLSLPGNNLYVISVNPLDLVLFLHGHIPECHSVEKRWRFKRRSGPFVARLIVMQQSRVWIRLLPTTNSVDPWVGFHRRRHGSALKAGLWGATEARKIYGKISLVTCDPGDVLTLTMFAHYQVKLPVDPGAFLTRTEFVYRQMTSVTWVLSFPGHCPHVIRWASGDPAAVLTWTLSACHQVGFWWPGCCPYLDTVRMSSGGLLVTRLTSLRPAVLPVNLSPRTIRPLATSLGNNYVLMRRCGIIYFLQNIEHVGPF